jgi:hypothetical protein
VSIAIDHTLRSRVRRKSHARFWIGGGKSDLPADHTFMLEQRWRNGCKDSFMAAANNTSSIHHYGNYCTNMCILFRSIKFWLGLDRVHWRREQNYNHKHLQRDYHSNRTATNKNTLGLVMVTCRTCYTFCCRIWGSLVYYATRQSG